MERVARRPATSRCCPSIRLPRESQSLIASRTAPGSTHWSGHPDRRHPSRDPLGRGGERSGGGMHHELVEHRPDRPGAAVRHLPSGRSCGVGATCRDRRPVHENPDRRRSGRSQRNSGRARPPIRRAGQRPRQSDRLGSGVIACTRSAVDTDPAGEPTGRARCARRPRRRRGRATPPWRGGIVGSRDLRRSTRSAVATRAAADGTISPPLVLSGEFGVNDAGSVTLAVNANGAAVLGAQVNSHVNVTTRPDQTGNWEPFTPLFTDATASTSHPLGGWRIARRYEPRPVLAAGRRPPLMT